MKILHIARQRDELVIELARYQEGTHQVAVLLVQDGVYTSKAPEGIPVYALGADLEARGLPVGPGAVDHDGAIRLIAEHDRVIVW